MQNRKLQATLAIAILGGMVGMIYHSGMKQRAEWEAARVFRSNPDNFVFPNCFNTETWASVWHAPFNGRWYVKLHGNEKYRMLDYDQSWRMYRKELGELRCHES